MASATAANAAKANPNPTTVKTAEDAIAEANKALKDWEKQHPNEVVNGVQ